MFQILYKGKIAILELHLTIIKWLPCRCSLKAQNLIQLAIRLCYMSACCLLFFTDSINLILLMTVQEFALCFWEWKSFNSLPDCNKEGFVCINYCFSRVLSYSLEF